jgi:hypothetical protein
VPVRIAVSSELLVWARERSRRDYAELRHRFQKLSDWEAGTAQPTLVQLEQFARATYTPLGLLLLSEPPADELPLPDYRTVRGARFGPPSPALLDTIYVCTQRQDWYREFASAAGEPRLEFVGSAQLSDDPVQVAGAMLQHLGFGAAVRREYATWTEALRGLIDLGEAAGASGSARAPTASLDTRSPTATAISASADRSLRAAGRRLRLRSLTSSRAWARASAWHRGPTGRLRKPPRHT